MATTGADAVFVDTNVLVYANQSRALHHTAALTALARWTEAAAPLWISHQVLREYVAVVTRPQAGEPALSMAVALQRVEHFRRRFAVAPDGDATFAALLAILREVPVGGRQVHDANLVATMRAFGLTRLLTFNVTDFRRFGAMITVLTP